MRDLKKIFDWGLGRKPARMFAMASNGAKRETQLASRSVCIFLS
jgi:hypothetical protein